MLIILVSEPASAFNWNRCKRITFDRPDTGARTFLSTSQFTSSTGACSLIGKAERDAKIFIAHNREKLAQDFAKGSGEYARAFARIYNCNAESQYRIIQNINENFSYYIELKDDEQIYNFLKSEVKKDGSCSARSWYFNS